MKYLIATLFQLLNAVAVADPPGPATDTSEHFAVIDEPFITQYGMGVQKLPMDGGKIYGWEVNQHVTFGRFKGESDEFGFSVKLNPRERLEITTDGFRWRKAIGGTR